MVRRITKKPALKISVFPELPGAVFYGDILDEHIDEATHLQRIRDGYETDLCQVTLHHELGRIGWGYDEIMGAVLNPATITSYGYGVRPGMSLASLVAVSACRRGGWRGRYDRRGAA